MFLRLEIVFGQMTVTEFMTLVFKVLFIVFFPLSPQWMIYFLKFN